tara:strand:- start:109 stop:987 length:879 start_codon:yes stop_codon:yes gene_type:complete
MDRKKILEAGKIVSEIREDARSFIKKGMLLIEIANRIEDKMEAMRVKPAFPTCLSINDIAAHGTPSYDDKRVAEGLLKIDMGVHIDGWISDTAFSLDLEDSEENKKIIKASEEALENVIKKIKKGIGIREIGQTVMETMESQGFSPIINLFGHEVRNYELHSEISIPNFDNRNDTPLPVGLYAIEPFATSGSGKIHDGGPSGIYMLLDDKNIRSPIAREVLELIKKEYTSLPFCSRWIVKKLGAKALIGLKQLESNGNLHHYAELVENSHENVAQTEHTILVEDGGITVTTK